MFQTRIRYVPPPFALATVQKTWGATLSPLTPFSTIVSGPESNMCVYFTFLHLVNYLVTINQQFGHEAKENHIGQAWFPAIYRHHKTFFFATSLHTSQRTHSFSHNIISLASIFFAIFSFSVLPSRTELQNGHFLLVTRYLRQQRSKCTLFTNALSSTWWMILFSMHTFLQPIICIRKVVVDRYRWYSCVCKQHTTNQNALQALAGDILGQSYFDSGSFFKQRLVAVNSAARILQSFLCALPDDSFGNWQLASLQYPKNTCRGLRLISSMMPRRGGLPRAFELISCLREFLGGASGNTNTDSPCNELIAVVTVSSVVVLVWWSRFNEIFVSSFIHIAFDAFSPAPLLQLLLLLLLRAPLLQQGSNNDNNNQHLLVDNIGYYENLNKGKRLYSLGYYNDASHYFWQAVLLHWTQQSSQSLHSTFSSSQLHQYYSANDAFVPFFKMLHKFK